MKFIAWPFQWIKVLPFVAVSGAMIFAALCQWAGQVLWIEAAAGWRVYVLGACLLGSLLFLIGLSLGRVVVGLFVCVWLAWPMLPYFFPPRAPVLAQPPPGTPPPPEIKLAIFNVKQGNATPDLIARILAWDADVVILMEVTDVFYRESFQAVRENYVEQSIGADTGATGLWCFTRLPVAKDLSRTRGKAAGVPACDWLLALPDGSHFRLLAMHPPGPLAPPEGAWRKALDAATGVLADCRDAAVFAGDLNCTPFAATFSEVLATTRLRDSALGHGLGATWSPAPFIGLPTDHALVSDHWRVIQRSIGDRLGSNHRPILLTLRKLR